MARGDFMGDIISIAATSYVEVQPASGDEWVLKAWGASDQAWTGYKLFAYDGTNRVFLQTNNSADLSAPLSFSVPVDNATYLSFYNGGGEEVEFYYGAYKTKE